MSETLGFGPETETTTETTTGPETETTTGPETETATETTTGPEQLSKENAREIVDNFLNSPENDITGELALLKEMEEKLTTLPVDIREQYNQLKIKIESEMKNDPNFMAAMEQIGVFVDKNNNKTLDQFGEPEAGNYVSSILENPDTMEQIKTLRVTINAVYNNKALLSKQQREAVDTGIMAFKGEISEVFANYLVREKNGGDVSDSYEKAA